MIGPSELEPHKRVSGRSTPDPHEHVPTDKHGRSLQTQHDAQPYWSPGMESRLLGKRHQTNAKGLFKP